MIMLVLSRGVDTDRLLVSILFLNFDLSLLTWLLLEQLMFIVAQSEQVTPFVEIFLAKLFIKADLFGITKRNIAKSTLVDSHLRHT